MRGRYFTFFELFINRNNVLPTVDNVVLSTGNNVVPSTVNNVGLPTVVQS